MGPNGATAVAVGLWFLVTVSVAAGPDVAAPRRCILSHYRSLDPRALAAVKAPRDRYVSDAQHPSPIPRIPGPAGVGDAGPCPEGPGIQASARRISDVRVQNSEHEIFRAPEL